MEQIYATRAGGPEVFRVKHVNIPTLKMDQVLIKVAATTVNKLDLLLRNCGQNRFGIECSGEIVEVGKMVSVWKPKDKVCALLPAGGGYAEYVAVNAYLVISAPAGIPLEHAAALPNAGALFWQSFFILNRLQIRERILIHSAAGGVGSFAIQVLKLYGCEVFVTAGTDEKLQYCKNLGADVCINHKRADFEEYLASVLAGRGFDFILDCSGEKHFPMNLKYLAMNGKLIVIWLDNEGVVDIDMCLISEKRLEVMGVDIRTEGLSGMHHLLGSLENYLWPSINKSEVKPQICASFKFSEVSAAHKMMEENNYFGKILLIPDRAQRSE